MKSFLTTTIFLLILITNGKAQVEFGVSVEEINFNIDYGLQSYAKGYYNGTWYLMGGRTDGLHQRQPFASFSPNNNHSNILTINFNNQTTQAYSINNLPTPVKEQLESTNIQFVQVNNMLFLIGGYGFSTTKGNHITHSLLTAINLPQLEIELKNNGNIANAFSFVEDSNMAVTGGYLHYLNDTFYLIGGHLFNGRYNPQGPNHGPGFVQKYTEEIRKFSVATSPVLSIQNYRAIKNAQEFHRRDYNVASTIFPDGKKGFTAFSGVFRHTVDLPWENAVDILENDIQVRSDFSQKLSHYHSAHLSIFNGEKNSMDYLFFGGIAKYYFDENNQLIDDPNVPFVKTISLVRRDNKNALTEMALNNKMPGFLGAGAEFFPVDASFFDTENILHINEVANQKVLVGYIYGGIESSAKNIFFVNTGSQSNATSRVFEVYIDKTVTSEFNQVLVTSQPKLNAGYRIKYKQIIIDAENIGTSPFDIEVYGIDGKLIYREQNLSSNHLPHTIAANNFNCKVAIVKLVSKNVNLSSKLILQ